MLRHRVGPFASSRKQVVVGDDLVDETDLGGLEGSDDARGQHEFERLRHADETRQQVGAPEAGEQPELREREAQLRALRGDPEVARQHHRHADADRRPIDRCDHRLRERDEVERKLAEEVLLSEPRAAGRRGAGLVRLQLLEIDAGAERAAGPGPDDGADGCVLATAREGGDHLVAHRQRVRVQLLRPMQRDRRHAVFDLETDVLGVAHSSV